MINVLLILKISLIIYIFLLLRIVGYHQLINYTQMYVLYSTIYIFVHLFHLDQLLDQLFRSSAVVVLIIYTP